MNCITLSTYIFRTTHEYTPFSNGISHPHIYTFASRMPYSRMGRSTYTTPEQWEYIELIWTLFPHVSALAGFLLGLSTRATFVRLTKHDRFPHSSHPITFAGFTWLSVSGGGGLSWEVLCKLKWPLLFKFFIALLTRVIILDCVVDYVVRL